MKLKTTFLTIITIVLGLTIAEAQTVISNQNFDAFAAPAMPTGWTTTTISGIGWRTDSTNFSNYTGASGSKNMVIKNSDSTGTYILTSPSINTTNYSNITVLWATRVSNNFLSSGSTTPLLSYSIDGGSNWISLTYTDNAANSAWALVNSGIAISIPSNANNISDLRLRWSIDIINNASGTYRIDDFVVAGNNANGVHEILSNRTMSVFPNPAKENFVINYEGKSSSKYSIQLFDITGKKIKENATISFPYNFERSNLESGVYLVRVVDEQNTTSTFKLVLQ